VIVLCNQVLTDHHSICSSFRHSIDRGSIPRDGVITFGLVLKSNVATAGLPVRFWHSATFGLLAAAFISNPYLLLSFHSFQSVVVVVSYILASLVQVSVVCVSMVALRS